MQGAFRSRVWVPVVGLLLGLCGCSALPAARVDDYRKRVQALQAENSELRTVVLNLRSQNHDMAQRAVDDARRLRAQDEAIRRLEQSVAVYQEEREQWAAQLEQIKSQVRMAAMAPPPTAMIERLKSFAQSHAACRFEVEPSSLWLPVETLFRPNTSEISHEGEALLDDLARLFESSPAVSDRLAMRLVGPTEPGQVRQASLGENAVTSSRADRAFDRVRRLQDWFSARSGIEADRIAVSTFGPSSTDGLKQASAQAPPSIVIEVRAMAVDANSPFHVGS